MKARMIFAAIALCIMTMLPTAASHAATASGAKSPAELVAKYKQALNKHDLKALHAICYWPGVSVSDTKMIEQTQVGFFSLQVVSVKFRKDVNGNKPLTIPIQGKQVPLNLPLAGYLDVQFSGTKDVPMANGAVAHIANQKQSFWVGKKNGAYYIAFLSEKD